MGSSAPPALFAASPSEERRHAIAALPPDAVAEHMDALVALLRDDDWRVRREAALALARVPDPAVALAPLLDAVCDDEVLARNAALEALRNIGGAAAEAVLARLDTARGAARRFLIEALLEGADARCVPTLRALLDDPDGNVPPAATEVLGVIPGAAALAALGAAAEHADPVVRLAALLAFEQRREVARWEAVSALVDDRVCAAHAIRALAVLAEGRAMLRVAEALVSPRPAVATAALLACARVARARDARRPLLAASLREVFPRVAGGLVARVEQGLPAHRVAALHTLALVGDPATLDVILRACAADDADVDDAADDALAALPPSCATTLLARLPALDAASVSVALAWLLQHGGPDDAPAIVAAAWRLLDGPRAPVAAWEVVAQFGADDDVRMLAERLGRMLAPDAPFDSDAPAIVERLMRRHRDAVEPLLASFVAPTPRGLSAALALARAGVAVDVARVEEALAADDPAVRAAAVRALGAARASLPLERLRPVLSDASPALRAALADAVRDGVADEEALFGVLGGACDDPAVRAAAASRLGRRGHGADPRLLRALSDDDGGVTLAVLDALGDAAPVAALVEATRRDDPTLVAESLARLAERDAEAAAARALALLDHPAIDVRAQAARSLRGRRDARPALGALLGREADPDLRALVESLLEG